MTEMSPSPNENGSGWKKAAIIVYTNVCKMFSILMLAHLFQIVFFLLSMCLFCTVACGIWEILTGRYHAHQYSTVHAIGDLCSIS